MQDIENMEVTDGTDATEDVAAAEDVHVRPELLPGVAPATEEAAAPPSTEAGEAVVAEGAPMQDDTDQVAVAEAEDTLTEEPVIVNVDNKEPYGVAPCYDMVFVGYEGECGWIPGYEEEEIGEAVTEQAQVGTTNPPTLAETGGVDMVSGAVLGLVLLTAGASAFIISKIKTA